MLKRYLNKNWASWTRVFKCFYGTKNLILIIRTECCWGKKFTASLSVFIWPVWQGPTLYLLACISIKTNYRSDLFYECSLREGDSSKVRHGHSWVGLMADGLMWLEDVWKHQAVPGWQLTNSYLGLGQVAEGVWPPLLLGVSEVLHLYLTQRVLPTWKTNILQLQPQVDHS